MKKNNLNFFLFCFIIQFTSGQIFQSELLNKSASLLYYQGMYPNVNQALALSEDYNSSEDDLHDISYFQMVTSLRLNEPGALDLIEKFNLDYPNNYVLKNVYFDLANYYFNNEKYSYAQKWFNRVKASDVPRTSLPIYYFNKGYTFFNKKKYQQAKSLLDKVKFNPKYESDAHYYLGHIAYQLEDYEGASSSFNRVSKSDQQENLGYFQVEMNFKLGRFKKAIELGEEELKKTSSDNYSSLSKIIGESYFNTEDYAKAIVFLKNYKGKNRKWKHEDFYQLGYAYYEIGEYSKAIDQFSKIIGKKDKLAQNAYYYLAECYLKNKRKSSALNAYRSASSMQFNPDITKISLLNYARLSYEIGNPYEAVTKVIIRFLESYSKSQYEHELTSFLLSSYTNSGSYDEVIALLSSQNDYKDERLLQKVSFLKAIQLFSSGNYQKAILYFQNSIDIDQNNDITYQSFFWKGQSEYELNNFQESLKSFKEFEKKSQSEDFFDLLQYHYNLGYTLFKMKDYALSLKAFEKVTESKEVYSISKIRDAFLRLGDANFGLGQFWPAMEKYNKSILLSPAQSDYALYQKSICYGFVDRNQQKISTLEELIDKYPSSPFIDDAYFELGVTYTIIASPQTAINTFDTLVKYFPKSPYFSRAILNKGLILYNQGKLINAQQILKNLVVLYPKDVMAKQALGTLKEISIDLDNVPEFTLWLRTLKIDTYSDNELEKTAFAAAEKQYLSNRKKQAKKSFLYYLDVYPSGFNSITSRFTLAEIYNEEENFDEALNYYRQTIDQGPSEYREEALVNASKILINNLLFKDVIPLLKELSEVAVFPENKRYSIFNLMRIYYQSNEFVKALDKVEEVLAMKHLDPKIKWDAYDILAHSSLKVNDSVKAKNAFKILEKSPIDKLAAEAYYFDAYNYFLIKDYKKSNEIIATLSQKFSTQPLWAAKSLLLMAKNFYALDDSFQATYILESLMENYAHFEDLSSVAKSLLEEIKQKESEQNASLSKPQDDE